MAKWESRFKGDFLSAAELGDRRPTFTIDRIAHTKVEDEKKKNVDRAVMYFKELDRGWMYCKTTGHCMAKMFGEDDDAWIGKRITIYGDPSIQFGGEQVGGIRIAGSPDLKEAMTVRIKFPKKKPFEVKLIPTKAQPAKLAGPPHVEPNPIDKDKQQPKQEA
jgi:hypothetical protein